MEILTRANETKSNKSNISEWKLSFLQNFVLWEFSTIQYVKQMHVVIAASYILSQISLIMHVAIATLKNGYSYDS